MVQISKRKLSGSLELPGTDTTIILKCDEECSPIGVVSFRSGAKRFVQFIEDGDRFLGRFVVRKADIPELGSALFYVILCGAASDQKTNAIKIEADIEEIKKDTVSQESDEIESIKAEIGSIRESISKLTKGLAIPKLDIHGPGCTEPGMVPMAIDDRGTFVPGHPFADSVHSVNGRKCVDGSIVIDASMIEYTQGKTIADYLADLANAIESVNSFAQALRDRLGEVSSQLNDLSLRVSARIDGGAM